MRFRLFFPEKNYAILFYNFLQYYYDQITTIIIHHVLIDSVRHLMLMFWLMIVNRTIRRAFLFL